MHPDNTCEIALVEAVDVSELDKENLASFEAEEDTHQNNETQGYMEAIRERTIRAFSQGV